MNVNFGLFSPLEGRIPKKLRGAAYAERALEALESVDGRGGVKKTGKLKAFFLSFPSSCLGMKLWPKLCLGTSYRLALNRQFIVGGDLCVPPLRAHTQVRPYVSSEYF